MLKPFLTKMLTFFRKKIILCAKGGDFKKGVLDSDFMFVNIEPYKSKKCQFKLSKYCDIDARLEHIRKLFKTREMMLFRFKIIAL